MRLIVQVVAWMSCVIWRRESLFWEAAHSLDFRDHHLEERLMLGMLLVISLASYIREDIYLA